MGNILPQRGPPESGAEQSSSSGLGALGLGQQHPPFNAQYYYPPPRGGVGHGKYFGGTFIMGGDKFEMSQPEAYLFGDNLDLNYLGGRPCPFPYSAPLPNEPMHMLRALVNIRKETLKLVAVPPGPQEVVVVQEDGETDNLSGAEVPPPPPAVLPSTAQQQPPQQQQYAIEFIFDADVDCTITIYLLCREEILLCSSSTSTTTTGVRYTPKDPRHRSPPYRYKAGIGQHFSQSSPLFNPHQYHAPDLSYHVLDEKGEYNATALYPLVIHVVADGDGSGGGDRGDGIEDICLSTSSSSSKQSHTLIASLEKLYEEVFSLKPLKQKLFVDGLSYLLQEIYGIENKVASSSSSASSNTASNGVNKNSSENAKNSPTTTGHHFLPSSTSEEDSSENSYECVICMSDLRDTLILPCRHLCLCKSCANSLRYQANNCPICRVPFRALLQIKAVKRQQQQQQPLQSPMMMINSSAAAVNNGVNNSGGGGSSHNVHSSSGGGGNTTTANTLGSNLLSSNHIININSQQHLVVSESLNELTVDIPPGFEIVPLVEALNGVVQQQSGTSGSNHQLSYSVPKHLKQQQQHSPTPQLPHVLPPSRDGGVDLSPEEHLSEKSLGSADFEAGAAKSKKSKKKSGSSSLESMSNCYNNNNNNNNHSAAKFDIDVDCGEGGGGGGGGDCDVQHPLEDIVSFRKKSGADEYDIKYFYSNSSPPKVSKGQQPQKSTNRSNHHHHHHHHQPKMYIPVATSAPTTTTSTSTDDSTSASSSVSSSGGASGVEGMGVTVQEKTRLLRKSSSKTGGGSLEQPAAVIVGSGNSSSNGGDHSYRHSQPHSHSHHHRQLDQSSQSDDYCAEEAAAAAVVVGDEEGEEVVVAEVDPDDDNDGDPVVVAAIQQQHSSRAT